MAFLFFTNAAEDFKGQSIAINTDLIVSILERKVTVAAEGGNKDVTTTLLYAGVNGSWEVTDPYLEVVARLNNKQ